MESLVLLTLPLSLLAVIAALGLSFLDVVRNGPHRGRSAKLARQWQPPLAQGNELLAWAANTAESVTARRIATGRRTGLATLLAAEICDATSTAIAQSPTAVSQNEPQCASCRRQMIGVTPPEALAIADAIRESKSQREVSRIRASAAQNAQLVAALDHDAYERAAVLCPLFVGDDACAAFHARPVMCRSWRKSSGAAESAGSADDPVRAIGRGVEAGFARGLIAAGLDGRVYELNSALTTAFDEPQAVWRWAAAEPVFESCKRYD